MLASRAATDYGRLYRRDLKQEADQLIDLIVHTGLEDYAAYRYAVGKLHGLELAIERFDEMRLRERRDEGEEEESE